MSEAILFDTEVNSLVHKEVIQLAWCKMKIVNGVAEYHTTGGGSFRPENPVDASCAAVHHIIAEYLDQCDPSSEATIPPAEYLIAHNVDFDAEVMKCGQEKKRICTLAIARRMWPEFTSHTLSATYLALYGQSRETIELLQGAHDAEGDIKILQKVLDRILSEANIKTIEELWEFSEVARVPEFFTFGKYKGERIKDTPVDYSQWLLKQPDVDQYLRKALLERVHGRALL